MNAVHAEGLTASANSAFMYGIGAAVAALITLVSIVFALRSYRAAVAAGIDKRRSAPSSAQVRYLR